jgi:hypothetical protein
MRAVLLLGVLCAGCTSVLGLDERELAPMDDSAVVDSSVVEEDVAMPDVSESPDTSMIADTSSMPDVPVLPDVPPKDSTPLVDSSPAVDSAPADTAPPGCPFFGLSCSPTQDCIVSRSTTGTYSVACESPPVGGKAGSDCVYDGKAYRCAEGYACRDRYPTGTICEPLCTTNSDCASPYPRCQDATWSPATPSSQICNVCDPIHYLQGCGTARCGAVSATLPPTCRPASDFGTGTAGAACNATTPCREAYTCLCGTDFGFTGCSGKSGTCVKLCDTTATCSTGLTCKPLVTGSKVQGCL